MCFVIKQARKPKLRVAKKDIVCYKVVSWYGKKAVPFFQSHRNKKYTYTLNRLARLVPIKPIGGYVWRYNDHAYLVEEGYHSYVKQEMGLNAKCIIPKGTKYLVNHEDGVYVSERIKIIEKIGQVEC